MKNQLKQIVDEAVTFFENIFLETERALRIVILTTTGCNAQCHYCYQHHLTEENVEFLTKENADKIINFAIEYQKKHPRKIDFRWFGGEPLLNYKIVNYICDELQKNGIRYKSHMITNGVLLNEQMFQETIKHKWNLDKIQITLDGTELEHNKIKNYKNKQINGFQTTINNIQNILENHEMRIDIRLNLSPTNKEDFLNLINYLKEKNIFYNNKL